MLLGVNIDHVATLRNARGGFEPSVLDAAKICIDKGVNCITLEKIDATSAIMIYLL